MVTKTMIIVPRGWKWSIRERKSDLNKFEFHVERPASSRNCESTQSAIDHSRVCLLISTRVHSLLSVSSHHHPSVLSTSVIPSRPKSDPNHLQEGPYTRTNRRSRHQGQCFLGFSVQRGSFTTLLNWGCWLWVLWYLTGLNWLLTFAVLSYLVLTDSM